MLRTPYPGHDVLANRDTPSWNDQTRRVIDQRLNQVPGRRFFDEREWAVLTALCDRVLPQPDRDPPVPLAPWIDDAMARGSTTGTRRASLPEDRIAWRKGLAGLDGEAKVRTGLGFPETGAEAQDAVLRAVDSGDATAEDWGELPAQEFFRHIALKRIVQIYYAHPAAMSEIGFGGPASPRGYVRLKANRADPWEARFGEWPQS